MNIAYEPGEARSASVLPPPVCTTCPGWCGWRGRCATVDIPDVNSDEYWFDGVFQHQRYERDVYRAIEAAGLKGRNKSCSLTKA